MLDVLGSDFLRTAQAKGSDDGLERSSSTALRTALIPMATFFAYEFALLFVGATFTEKHIRLARHGRVVRRLGHEERRQLGRRRDAVRRACSCCSPASCRTSRTPRSTRECGCSSWRNERARNSSRSKPAQADRTRSRPSREHAWSRAASFGSVLPWPASCRRRCCCSRSPTWPVRHRVAIQPARHERIPVAAVGRALVRHHAERASTCSRSRCAACRSR